MNKKQTLLILCGFSFILTAPSYAQKLSAKEIMIKNEEARKVDDFSAQATLTTGNADDASNSKKVKEFTLQRKTQSNGTYNSTLTRFHSPAEVRNEGILIIENSSGKNDVLMYLPNFKKVRRVESQQQSGSFMGSVFSYSDIATPHVDDYHYQELKTEACPTHEANSKDEKGILCTVIECTPANDSIRERTGYSKAMIWVRNDNYMTSAGEYYNTEGKLFKKLEASQIKLVDPAKKKWHAHLVVMKNLTTKEYTSLAFKNVKVNQEISDAIFTQQNLQKVK